MFSDVVCFVEEWDMIFALWEVAFRQVWGSVLRLHFGDWDGLMSYGLRTNLTVEHCFCLVVGSNC